jgi:hypothetical protein
MDRPGQGLDALIIAEVEAAHAFHAADIALGEEVPDGIAPGGVDRQAQEMVTRLVWDLHGHRTPRSR